MLMTILQPLLTTAFGALVSIIAWKVQKAHADRSLRDMVVLQGFNADSIVKLQGGSDQADPWTRCTRRLLALMFGGTFCFIIIYLLMNQAVIPTIELVVPQKLPLWWKLFGILPKTEQTVIEISFLTMYMMSFKVIIEFLAGFYFVKMGK